ncbi:endo-1,4-B-xylanase A [Schizopora paradoxa]|uniref:Beta-xylanase n=1 Tax=Schizopora paradoxa TaxID=27342 RepID=A0A0H2RG12_9AGAM|nr:endo-1,4-B-xylanase A [Schizopora paradoxa]
MKLSASFASLLALVSFAAAQSQLWGQCGGIGWTGPTTCVSGSVCTVSNAYYSQCLPGSAAPTTVVPPPSQPTTTAPTGGSPPPSGSGLDSVAKGAGKKYFGTASDTNEFSDTAYMAILNQAGMFGALTPLNSMKWDSTEPSRGSFSFTNADQVVARAKQNGQIMRGHNCVWYNQLPSWVSSSGFNSTTLTSVIQTHCSTLVGHYKGEIYAWDVINEPFNDDGTWRSDVFYNTLGTNYVQIGLQSAKGADGNAKLYINEYNIEMTGAKATSMINLVKSLKSAGVPIDGVGFQCHFIVGEVPTSMSSVMSQITAMGLEVAITELDIRMTLPSTQALLNQQQTDYENVIKQCMAVAGCVGISIWDFTDKYSWVPQTFSGQGAALPWDQNLAKKPAYNGIVAGF